MFTLNMLWLVALIVIVIIFSFILWAFVRKEFYENKLKKTWDSIQQKIEKWNKEYTQLLEKANSEYVSIMDKVKRNSQSEYDKIVDSWEKKVTQLEQSATKQIDFKYKEIESLRNDIEKREQKMETQISELTEKEKQVALRDKELQDIIEEEKIKLLDVAKLTLEEAREKLFDIIKDKYSWNIQTFIEKIKREKNEVATKEANEVIARILPRVAVQWTNDFLISLVELPSEDYKWRIIWREWRNISYFEKLTWVEISMDDTPCVVKISSYDADKRYIAVQTLNDLVKDWRINPFYIKKYHTEALEKFPEIVLEIWRQTLIELWIPMLDNEIMEYIGKFQFRYSYGQNLLYHSKEVARLAELLASELWYDSLLAKKAWILHDIWKIDTKAWESHAKLWAEILRKYKVNDIIINAAEWHHYDVPLEHPISYIVTAADAISAWREWVRFNTKEQYLERMKTLEDLIKNVYGIDKVYIMQAWREIWGFVNAEQIDDLKMHDLSKDIVKKIWEQLDYPWVIRVVLNRDTKVIDFVN